jgi:two-component system, LytTR family, response regulator
MQALIIDDEKRGREMFENLVKTHCPSIEVVASVGSFAEARQALNAYSPDLVFLDIELSEGTGFDLLDSVDIDFHVIFTTAYETYAIKAIKFSAIDYLLKPVDPKELVKAVEKTESVLIQQNFKKQYENLHYNTEHQEKKLKRLAIPLQDGLLFVEIQDILRCVAEGAYTYFHLKNGAKHLVSKNLKEYEELLGDSDFCRVHHSHLINLNEVKKYVKGEGGYVIMTDDVVVDVSKRKKETLLSRFKKL